MSLDLVVFDLDGRLCDSAPDIAGALQRVLARMGRAPVSTEKVVAAIGSGVKKLIERTVEPPFDPVFEGFMSEYRAHLIDKTSLFPGVKKTLEAIPIPKIVLSNKPEDMTRRVVEGLGIAGHFRAVYGGDSFPARKPDPATFRAAVDGAEKVLLVGDSGTDLQTARNGGALMCAVTFGYFKPDELDGADFYIDRFEQLLDVIPGL